MNNDLEFFLKITECKIKSIINDKELNDDEKIKILKEIKEIKKLIELIIEINKLIYKGEN